MSLRNYTQEQLEDKFEMFLFNMSDYLENIIAKAAQQGLMLDYSLDSLENLEAYLKENKITKDSEEVNDAACYFGEVVRKKYGGRWKCSLDLENNSRYYGKPVITEHTTPKDLELSPFDAVIGYTIRPREHHFAKIIENHIETQPLDLSEFPDE
jgi:hypothetical protein